MVRRETEEMSAPTLPASAASDLFGPWQWVEPASAVSSLAFVVAGTWVVVTARRRDERLVRDGSSASARRQSDGEAASRHRIALGVLAVLVGVGSVIQHGPAPSWNAVAHDPPLAGVYALVAADSIADLTGRRMRTWWWLAPTLVDVVLAAAWHPGSVVVQTAAGVAAVAATTLRAVARPGVRRRAMAALVVLATGSVIGTMTRSGWPWADADGWFGGWLNGHAVWHVLAATAIAIVAPMIGSRDNDERLCS